MDQELFPYITVEIFRSDLLSLALKEKPMENINYLAFRLSTLLCGCDL